MFILLQHINIGNYTSIKGEKFIMKIEDAFVQDWAKIA